mmetsp:Transcript_1932/g.4249  ORF Transcript_1932/g.4249 Transcript_1932/m.4249 type:complete len:377 (+) Transcript_1932:70-1200(+)
MDMSNSSNCKGAKRKKEAKDDMKKKYSPPKPYTKYTIFFRLERMRLLLESGLIDDEIKATLLPDHFDSIEHPRPSKYKDVQMPPFWYSSFVKPKYIEKRKHRKIEGRISFKELSQKIAASWKEIDEETAAYIDKLANFEQSKYDEKFLGVLNGRNRAEREEGDGIDETAEKEVLETYSNGTVNIAKRTIFRRDSVPVSFSPGERFGMNYNFVNLRECTQETIIESGYQARLLVHQKMQNQLIQMAMKNGDLETTGRFSNLETEDTSLLNRGSKRSFFGLPPEIHANSHWRKRRSIDCTSDPTIWSRTGNSSFFQSDETIRDFQPRRRSSFTCVPEWHADDAMKLLKILSFVPDDPRKQDNDESTDHEAFVCGLCIT